VLSFWVPPRLAFHPAPRSASRRSKAWPQTTDYRSETLRAHRGLRAMIPFDFESC
jgi:hypothetical protein